MVRTLRSYDLAPGDVGENEPKAAVIFQPRNLTDVAQVISQHREMAASGRLFAFSTGYNWGYGSRKPFASGGVGLDLSLLDEIEAFDPNLGVAVIQPGVSQEQLAFAIRDSNFILNLTGSSRGSSILGNALDRGIGYLRRRSADILGLRVVLPTGQTIYTGGPWPAGTASTSRGMMCQAGPDLSPLFSQSNFGVVTGALVELVARASRTVVVRSISSGFNLGKVLLVIHGMLRREIVNTVSKTFTDWSNPVRGNSHDARSLSYICLRGEPEIVCAKRDYLLRLLETDGGFAKLRIFDEASSMVEASEDDIEIVNLYRGIPRSRSSFAKYFSVPDHCVDTESCRGLLSVLIGVPASERMLRVSAACARGAGAKAGVIVKTTYHVVNCVDIALLLCIEFTREDGSVLQARSEMRRCIRRFVQAGMAPLRFPVDFRFDARTSDWSGVGWVLEQVRHALDPNGIMMPGKSWSSDTI